jgi:hypothetical protein
MFLFLLQDLPQVLGHREFAERLALPDALAVVLDGLILRIEIVLMAISGRLL